MSFVSTMASPTESENSAVHLPHIHLAEGLISMSTRSPHNLSWTTGLPNVSSTFGYEEVALGQPITEEFKWIFFACYCVIFIFGMFGNILFCYVVISSRAMSTVTYRLLVNLSASDLLITCLSGPVHVIHSLIMGYWPFGEIGCYTFSYLQGISVLVSSYTLVVISFERYMSILHPLRPVIPRGSARWVILGIWLVSSAASIPNPVLTKYLLISGQWVCTNDMDTMYHYYSLVLCVFQYFLPLALMTYFYSMVAATIWRRRDICQVQAATQRGHRQIAMLNGKRKMIKMLIVVVACYTFCWLPFNIYWVLGLAEPSILNHWSFPYVFTTVHLLALSHTCFNPVIYCWMNSRVRYGFIDVFGKVQVMRKCLPSVDWDNTRLTRAAIPSQYTETRRNNTSTRPLVQRRPRRNNEINEETSEILARTSLNPKHEMEVTELSRNSLRLPKMSTVSNTFEMAELLRQEPLMQQTKQSRLGRQSKLSVVSNATQVTQITDLSDTGTTGIPPLTASSLLTEPAGFLRTSGSWKLKSQLRSNSLKGFERNNKEISDISEEHSSDVHAISPPPGPVKQTTSLSSTTNSEGAYVPHLRRSVSEEIAEQCLSDVMDVETKADDRYN